MTQRTALILAGLAGFTAVGAGAFGAHAIEGRVSPDLLEAYDVGARYHMYHALAILGMTPLLPKLGRLGPVAVWCFFIGLLIFAGTLYALALTGHRWLGAITPIGGLILLAGWVCIGIAALGLPTSTPPAVPGAPFRSPSPPSRAAGRTG
jgi:uncharacterized membrane protein YgdD (TMEM256/DUF423 family)